MNDTKSISQPHYEKVIDTIDGRFWATISTIDDLMKVGDHMHNALSNKLFAEEYDQKMHLYFLVDPETRNVVVNASFHKNGNGTHMIVGERNLKPADMYTKDIEILNSFINNSEKL